MNIYIPVQRSLVRCGVQVVSTVCPQVQVALLRPESVRVNLGRVVQVTEEFMDRIEEKR